MFLLYGLNFFKIIYMSYYFNTTIKDKSFEEVIETVKNELGKEGFGVPAEVDMQGTFKMKLGIDFRKYKILCACNPVYAKQAVDSEKNIGVMLPCSVAVQEHENGDVEVAAVDSVASMLAVKSPVVQEVAAEVARRLERVIQQIG